jgi:glycosyltransferase involved in cell wall biosynthesis
MSSRSTHTARTSEVHTEHQPFETTRPYRPEGPGEVAPAARPVASIVIPAHNESRVIERGLESILRDSAPGQLEIVVVCNGCSDDTAERARRFGSRVKVVETSVPSKISALNLGDQHVTAFPRFYVDADVQISGEAIRDVAGLLGEDSPIVVASPRAVVAYQDRPFLVRAFYRVWTRLPYFTENMIGSGVYALSRKGRARFDQFPTITADDEFARLIATPAERRASSESTFTIYPPRTARGLLAIATRLRSGVDEFRDKFPQLSANNNTNSKRTLEVIASTPSMWPDAPVYLGIMLLAKLKARTRQRDVSSRAWERDDTSRQSA